VLIYLSLYLQPRFQLAFFTIISVLTGVTTTYNTRLCYGGPVVSMTRWGGWWWQPSTAASRCPRRRSAPPTRPPAGSTTGAPSSRARLGSPCLLGHWMARILPGLSLPWLLFFFSTFLFLNTIPVPVFAGSTSWDRYA
jgi:hypothetical protein